MGSNELMLIGTIGGGFVVVSLILIVGFMNLKQALDKQVNFERRRQKILISREKAVLAASLIGEINENKNKCEAFVTIYAEMLRNLRDDSRKPSYQQTGDFVHKTPALSRNVYDSNIANLSMLDPIVATKLSEVYSMIETDPEYLSLEPDLPLDTAVRLVEMVVKNAEATHRSLNDLVPSLEVVVRNAPKVSL